MNDQDNGPETTEPAPAASNRAAANDAGRPIPRQVRRRPPKLCR